MKKIILTCSMIITLQLAVAQNIYYNGYMYSTSGFNKNDSTVTFFPVDKKKLAMLNPYNNNWVEYSVPGHPDKKEKLYIANKTIDQELSAYIEVFDTINKKRNTEEKQEYIKFRLSVLNAIREHLADIKTQEGKKLKEENEVQSRVYWKVMSKFGGEAGKKELTKNKVGKLSMAAISQFEEQMTMEENALRKVLEITDTIEFLKMGVDENGVIGKETESLARNLLHIEIPERLSGDAHWSYTKKYIKACLRFRESVFEIEKCNRKIYFKNPILADSPMTVRNPKYKGIGYEKWLWLQNMTGHAYNDGLEHVYTEFPVETNYHKSDKYTGYQFYSLENTIFHTYGWYVTDNNKNLIGVPYKGFEPDSLLKALMLYDFEHNAYNIQSESKGTQEWVLYLIKKRGNNEADALDRSRLGIMLGTGLVLDQAQKLQNLYARRKITKAEYDRQVAALKRQAKNVNQAANKIASSLPSDEEQDRAEKYVKQLENDYGNKYYPEDVNAERLNGTQMMLYTLDCKVQALMTYFLNDDGKLNIAIDIIKKLDAYK